MGLARFVAAGVVAGTTLLGMSLTFFTVDEVERGIVLRGGEAVRVAEPGWHAKVPILESVSKIGVSYSREELANMGALTSTGQGVVLRVSANFRIEPEDVLRRYRQMALLTGTWDTYLKPLLYSTIKDEVARLTPADLLTSREALVERVTARIRAELMAQGWAVTLQAVRVEHLKFTDDYQTAQEQSLAVVRMVAALGSIENYLSWQRTQKWDGVLPKTMPPGETSTVLGIGLGKKD